MPARIWYGVGLLFLSATLQAQSGVEWLRSRAQADGQYSAPADLVLPFQATAEATRTLRLLDQGDGLDPALGFLEAESYDGTGYLSQLVLARANAAPSVETDLLLARQNHDGGFGERAGYASSALHTAAALETLASTGLGELEQTADAVQYLLDAQNADGGWGDDSNGSQLETSAVVLRALAAYQGLGAEHALFDLITPMRAAADLLLAQRMGDGLWGEDFRSALVLQALTLVALDPSPLQPSIDALRGRQQADGSWGGDVYSTALALRALTIFELSGGDRDGSDDGGSDSGDEAAFEIASLDTTTGPLGAEAAHEFRARIANTGQALGAVDVRCELRDAQEKLVARLLPRRSASSVPQTRFELEAGATEELTIAWNTAQWPAGRYRLHLRLVQPDSKTPALPEGVVLARATSDADVISTRAIAGRSDFDPPVTQTGSATPVRLRAVLVNTGNLALETLALQLELRNAGGETLHTAQASVTALALAGFEYADFGLWTPTESGEYAATIRPLDATVAGAIDARLYVGAHPSGLFTVDREVVASGSSVVRATIEARGDDAIGATTDPRSLAVERAVANAGQFLSHEFATFQDGNHCVACHVHSQTLFGLATAQAKGSDVDPAGVIRASSAIASAQKLDGSLLTQSGSGTQRTLQTLLGSWALSAERDKAAQFRTRYRAVQYLQTNRIDCRSLNGAIQTAERQTCWRATGFPEPWFGSREAYAMMGARAFADLVRSAHDSSVVPTDYAMSPLMSVSPPYGGYFMHADLELGPNGMFYTLQRRAAGNTNLVQQAGGAVVLRLDPVAGTSAQIGLPGTPANLTGFAIADDGRYYLGTDDGKVLRVTPDAEAGVEVWYQSSGASALADLDFGPDGALYVADYGSNRVLKIDPSGTAEVWLEGGRLNGPYGLIFDRDGTLLIANRNGHDVLRVSAEREVSEYVSGLAYPPLHVAPAANGDLYVSHDTFTAVDVGQETEGLYRIRPDLRVERIWVTNGMIMGPLAQGERLFRVSGTGFGGNLAELTTVPLATVQLSEFRNELRYIARYFLTYRNDNNGDNLIHAMRLIGLGEARSVIDDAALRSEIDVATAAIAQLLRARQRSDGGWNRSNDARPSDAIVTAFAGMALDYTEPADDDPDIVAAIEFLLHTQRPDHAWDSSNAILETAFGATGAVMAWLPSALGRFGGIDTDVHLELPADASLSAPSVPPTQASTLPGGGMNYVWALERLTPEARRIEFDLTLHDMQVYEERRVASTAYLESANTFSADRLQVDLDIPLVRADDGLRLALSSDRSSYAAGESVPLNPSISNSGNAVAAGTVSLRVVAEADQSLVAELPPQTFAGLAAGAQRALPFSWPTASTRAGAYRGEARLMLPDGSLLDEASVSFVIKATADGPQLASLRSSTDRPVYHTSDRVEIDHLVQNLTHNHAIANAELRVRVVGPSGATLLSQQIALGELPPQAIREHRISQRLSAAAVGSYQIHANLIDAGGQVLTGADASYEVREDARLAIVGSVLASSASLAQGELQTCTASFSNRGTLAVSGLPVRQLVLRLVDDSVALSEEALLDLAPGNGQRRVHSFATRELAPGDYACVLQAEFDGTWIALGHALFALTPPPVQIEASLALGDHGRLLILLDPTPANGQQDDPFGPRNGPSLAEQRQALAALLTEQGWSYLITTDAAEFSQALRSGGFAAYAVFSESVHINRDLLNELREAVFRGEGLIEAGSHDQRNGALDELLGVRSTGMDPNATAVDFLPGPLSVGGRASFAVSDKTLKITLEGARLEASANNRPVLTTHSYGAGHSVYAGFDLVLQATASGTNSLFSDLLRAAPAYVQPPLDLVQIDRVIPLRLALANLGIATRGRVLISLPSGVFVEDASAAAQLDASGALSWPFDLSEGESTGMTVWLRLPAEPGMVTLQALIQIAAGDAYTDYASLDHVLEVEARPGLAEALAEVRVTPGLESVQSALETAVAAIEDGQFARALDRLLQAADTLARSDHPRAPAIRLMVSEAIRTTGAAL